MAAKARTDARASAFSSKQEDVSTTPRKSLTPRQRLALFEREKGVCCICGLKVTGSFIDEHKRALGLGGGNEPENRGVAHHECAAMKTAKEDIPAIAKAKRQKMRKHGIAPPKAKIQSRGFPDSGKTPKTDKIGLPPRRSMYEDAP